MLFLFTIDPIIFTSNIDRSLEDDLNDIFIYWKKIGVLVVLHPDASNSLLYKSIKSCTNSSIKDKWSSGLLRDKMRQINTDIDYENIWSAGSKNEILVGGDKVEIAVISEKNIKNFKIKINQLPTTVGSIDYLCLAKQFRRLSKVTDADNLCNMPLSSQLTNSDVWNTRYRKIINYSKIIHIYDRYCIESFMYSRKNNQDFSGLEQFIRRIANISSDCNKYIKIRSAIKIDDSTKISNEKNFLIKKFNEKFELIKDEMNEVFNNLIETSSIKEIDVQLVLDREFGSIEHYRHIRFDDYNIIVIDKGLSHFEGTVVRQTTPFQYLPWNSNLTKAYKEDEELLELRFYSANGKQFKINQFSIRN
jgi:hypothetical protein